MCEQVMIFATASTSIYNVRASYSREHFKSLIHIDASERL